MPLIVSIENATGPPFRVIEFRVLLGVCSGSIPWRPAAVVPTLIVKPREPPFQENPLKDEAFLPSTQSSICFADTTGTLRALAEATIASDPAELTWSVCMFTVKTP